VISQSELKYLRSLSQRKFRQKYNKFIAEGDKICSELLSVGSYSISKIYCTNEWYENHVTGLTRFKSIITIVNNKEIDQISQLKTSNKVLMVLDHSGVEKSISNINTNAAIYLDDIQDPGNVGTIIRIADWYGIKHVIRSAGTADFYSHKVIQASMASFANVFMYSSTFEQLIDDLPDHKSVGAVLGGEDINNFAWPAAPLIIMGNEGKGIKHTILEQLDEKIMIPGSPTRLADSLNVGIATAIMCQSMFTPK